MTTARDQAMIDDGGLDRIGVSARRTRPGLRDIRGWRRSAAAFIAPLFSWQALFALVPLLYLLTVSVWRLENFSAVPAFTLSNYATVLGTGYYWAGYLRSLQLSAVTSFVVLAIAVPAAYSLAWYCGERAKRILILLILLPLLTSYVVRVYAWHVILADNGLLNGMLAGIGLGPLHLLYTKAAIGIGLASYYLPVAVLIIFVGITSIDRPVLEAASNLGCGPFRIVREVVIPNTRRAIVVSYVFVFILTFGDVISPANLGGGHTYVLSIMILDRVKVNHWPEAAVMATWSLVTFVVLLACATRVMRRGVVRS